MILHDDDDDVCCLCFVVQALNPPATFFIFQFLVHSTLFPLPPLLTNNSVSKKREDFFKLISNANNNTHKTITKKVTFIRKLGTIDNDTYHEQTQNVEYGNKDRYFSRKIINLMKIPPIKCT